MAKKKPKKLSPEYELPRIASLPTLRILAMDPGSSNFGISCVGVRNDRPVVLANSKLRYPVNNLVDFLERRDLFLEEVARWVDHFKPNAIIAERFQTRGNGGPLIEYVAVMLGLIAGTYPNTPIKFITASTWKNAFKRRHFDLRLLYPDLKVEPHPFDATLIGIYGLEFGLKRLLKYDPFDLVDAVQNTSCIPLRVRRGDNGQVTKSTNRKSKAKV